jgi:hypothetical protein
MMYRTVVPGVGIMKFETGFTFSEETMLKNLAARVVARFKRSKSKRAVTQEAPKLQYVPQVRPRSVGVRHTLSRRAWGTRKARMVMARDSRRANRA